MNDQCGEGKGAVRVTFCFLLEYRWKEVGEVYQGAKVVCDVFW
jgi:hypothetical protein